jgi:hypothetical protein
VGRFKTALNDLKRIFSPKRIVLIVLTSIFFIAFQNCGKQQGAADLGSVGPLSKVETYMVADAYACQVQVSTQEACKTVLENYNGEFENVISPSSSPSQVIKGPVTISSDVSCELLKSGDMQCATMNEDGTVEYVSHIDLYDSNLDVNNVCAAVSCGVRQ